jgi:hypothetical protein
MENAESIFYKQVNYTRFHHQTVGHYESYFMRANHPEQPLAFWIRYTIFCPKDRPTDAIGELWAVVFNGETGHHVAAKQELPFMACDFSTDDFSVRVGDSFLQPGYFSGALQSSGNTIEWDLAFEGKSQPLLLLPLKLYETKFPAAKSLVSLPLAFFSGKLTVNGEAISVERWRGSQNHNWGVRHTDLYAWGQVSGFDNDPEAFLEIATARLRLGPFWSPAFTPIVLRYKGAEYGLRGLLQSLRANGSFEYFTWKFRSEVEHMAIEGKITAPPQAFVGLTYYNPPGGEKYCLNTKIAECTLRVKDRAAGTVQKLETKNRAAFEILTDDPVGHGIVMAV